MCIDVNVIKLNENYDSSKQGKETQLLSRNVSRQTKFCYGTSILY